MKPKFTAMIKQDGEQWVGHIKEMPKINCQEKSREALLKSLKAAVVEAVKQE